MSRTKPTDGELAQLAFAWDRWRRARGALLTLRGELEQVAAKGFTMTGTNVLSDRITKLLESV